MVHEEHHRHKSKKETSERHDSSETRSSRRRSEKRDRSRSRSRSPSPDEDVERDRRKEKERDRDRGRDRREKDKGRENEKHRSRRRKHESENEEEENKKDEADGKHESKERVFKSEKKDDNAGASESKRRRFTDSEAPITVKEEPGIVKPERSERRKRRWDDDDGNKASAPSTSEISALVSSIAAQVVATKGSEDSPSVKPVVAAPPGSVQAALEAVEKAKKAMLLQKQIQEQLKKTAPAVAALAAAAKTEASHLVLPPHVGFSSAPPAFSLGDQSLKFMPPPLIVDAQGREVDSRGSVMEKKPSVSSVATLKVNINRRKMAAFKVETPKLVTDPTKNPYYDPRINLPKMGRSKKSFSFVEEGKFIKKAERIRAKAAVAQYYRDKGMSRSEEGPSEPSASSEGGAAGAMEEDVNPNLIELGPRKGAGEVTLPPVLLEPVPDVEWWDLPLLPSGKYSDVLDGNMNFNIDSITIYVQHPIPIEPPAEAPAPPPKPMFLTKQERKKLRTRNRLEAEKEKQDKIRLGLMEPPPPKVKLSNLMRVMGNQAVADPTKVEAEVRAQVEARAKEHEDRNQARKLTPEERREKKRRKMLDDTSIETHVALFRVDDLSHKQKQYKVDVNAQENHLTGCAIIRDHISVVVVEGGPKTIRRYKKLMLKRIDWNETPAGDEDDEAPKAPKKENKCLLVWEGVVAKRNFENFRFEASKSDLDACNYLKKFGVEHYWNLAKSYVES